MIVDAVYKTNLKTGLSSGKAVNIRDVAERF